MVQIMAGGKSFALLAVLVGGCIQLCHSRVGLLLGESGPVKIEDTVVSPNTCKEFHSECGVTFFEVARVHKGCAHVSNVRACLQLFGCRLEELEVWDDYVNEVCATGEMSRGWNIIPSMGVMLLSVAAAIFMV